MHATWMPAELPPHGESAALKGLITGLSNPAVRFRVYGVSAGGGRRGGGDS